MRICGLPAAEVKKTEVSLQSQGESLGLFYLYNEKV